MLRASIEFEGRGDAPAEGLRAVTAGSKAGETAVAHGEKLTAFAEAAVAGNPAELATARDALRAAIGAAGLVDAAAVVGNFQRMVRIADATGIPLDGVVETLSSDFREDLGLESFQTRRGEGAGALGRMFGPLMRAAARIGMKTAGRRSRRRQEPQP